MEVWDQDYVDEEEVGYFGKNGIGNFHFGYVRGEIGYCLIMRDG
jgi:hypothetical protein